MTPDMIDVLRQFGLPTFILIVVLWSGAKGYWVYGYLYREQREENARLKEQYREDMAKERALSDSLLGVGERVATAAEKVTGVKQ